MRIVVALGGNALLRRGQPMTPENRVRNVAAACDHLAPIAHRHELVVSHGNGPQIGLLALESAASIVFDQAENRVHTIKAILVATLG